MAEVCVTEDEVPKAPCLGWHLVLALTAVAPLFVPVPVNVNIVVTAALTVLVGSLRSVKPTPPEDSMTKKVGERLKSGCIDDCA